MVDSNSYWWGLYENAAKFIRECGIEEYCIDVNSKAYTNTHAMVTFCVPAAGNAEAIKRLEANKKVERSVGFNKDGKRYNRYQIYTRREKREEDSDS